MSLLNRRRFLRGLAAAGVTVPFAQAMLNGLSHAQVDGPPVRFLAIRSFHGSYRDLWIPKTMSGAAPPSADEALSSLTFDYDNAILRPLQDWRDKITVLDGIDHAVVADVEPGYSGHGMAATALTGRGFPDSGGRPNPGGPSLDTYLANQLGPDAGTHLAVSVFGANDYRLLTYGMSGEPLIPEENPVSVFNNVFATYMGGGEPPDTSATQRVELGRSIIDRSMTEVQRLSARLSGPEREKLESHLEGLRTLERSLVNPPAPVDCGSPTAPGGGSIRDAWDWQGLENEAAKFADVIAQSFTCGLSRVASINLFSDYGSPQLRHPGQTRADEVSHGDDFHNSIVHDIWGGDEVTRAIYGLGMQWQTRVFARFLEALDVPDPADAIGGRTVLDNTVVYWTNELGNGGHADDFFQIPVIVAGGGGGAIRTGRYLRLRENGRSRSNMVPHNRALTSIIQAMGFRDVSYFGDPRVASDSSYAGPLTELLA